MTTPQRADAPAWTPEPWQASDNESDTHPSFHDVEYGHSVAMSASDYERAIACVNALAGIPDPAAHIRTLEAENARLTAALADAKAEGERMRAIVDRLPVTKDGVLVTPGMHIYEVDPVGCIAEYRVCGTWEKRDTSSRPLPAYAYERGCYSTYEGAEAARAAAALASGGQDAQSSQEQ